MVYVAEKCYVYHIHSQMSFLCCLHIHDKITSNKKYLVTTLAYMYILPFCSVLKINQVISLTEFLCHDTIRFFYSSA